MNECEILMDRAEPVVRIYQSDDGYEFIYFEKLTEDYEINFEDGGFQIIGEVNLKEDRLSFFESERDYKNKNSDFVCYEIKKKSVVIENPEMKEVNSEFVEVLENLKNDKQISIDDISNNQIPNLFKFNWRDTKPVILLLENYEIVNVNSHINFEGSAFKPLKHSLPIFD